MKPVFHCLTVALLSLSSCSRADERKSSIEALANAMAANDLAAIRTTVADARAVLGDNAGIPEVADDYKKAPADATLLTREEAQRGFAPHFAKLEKMRWWNVGADPVKLTAPLRGVASVITGHVAAARAKLDGAERGLAMAKEAADFLIWAQEQAGAGCYPFPAARGTSDARAMEVATRFLKQAEKAGTLDKVVRNGWAFDDLGDGGMQFDNGECGVAMFELYEMTKDARHLDSARKAADWAMARPLCTNWNYNSFSVHLLAKAHAVTGEAKYLDAAIHKARLGVIPGQLTDGPRAGRWMDAHNARPAYHYIMMCALAQLAAEMPPQHEHRAEIVKALMLGLKARNTEMVSLGVMNKDHALQALLLVRRAFANDAAFLTETKSVEALRSLALLVSAEAHHGKFPLSPGNWGEFLEYINQPSK
ncbi:MAG: hypothetical protein ABIP85_25695 [Chthoniobacteraceae bacterium]